MLFANVQLHEIHACRFIHALRSDYFLARARFEWCAKRNCKLTQLNFFLNLGGHPLKLRENKPIDSYAYESFQGYDAPE